MTREMMRTRKAVNLKKYGDYHSRERRLDCCLSRQFCHLEMTLCALLNDFSPRSKPLVTSAVWFS